MTPEQRELARHALGFPNKTRKSYRNHFCAGKDHRDYPEWMKMVENDLAKRHEGNYSLTGGDFVFILTTYGAELALKSGERLDKKDFPDINR